MESIFVRQGNAKSKCRSCGIPVAPNQRYCKKCEAYAQVAHQIQFIRLALEGVK